MPLITVATDVLDLRKKRKPEDIEVFERALNVVLKGRHITATEGANNDPSLQQDA